MRKSRGRLQNLVGSAQLFVFPLQSLESLAVVCRHTGPLTLVRLNSAHPTRSVSGVHPIFDAIEPSLTTRAVFLLVFKNQRTARSLTSGEYRFDLLYACSNPLKSWSKLGAVQSDERVDGYAVRPERLCMKGGPITLGSPRDLELPPATCRQFVPDKTRRQHHQGSRSRYVGIAPEHSCTTISGRIPPRYNTPFGCVTCG